MQSSPETAERSRRAEVPEAGLLPMHLADKGLEGVKTVDRDGSNPLQIGMFHIVRRFHVDDLLKCGLHQVQLEAKLLEMGRRITIVPDFVGHALDKVENSADVANSVTETHVEDSGIPQAVCRDLDVKYWAR